MDDNYPIELSIQGLFEDSDPKSDFLIDKLNAWLNFRTLAANWFADESCIPKVKIMVLPEPLFNDHEVTSADNWKIQQTSDAFFIHCIVPKSRTADVVLKLPLDTIKQAMDKPKTLEPTLQTMLTDVINHCASDFNLNVI